jgi:hypothetical protein
MNQDLVTGSGVAEVVERLFAVMDVPGTIPTMS